MSISPPKVAEIPPFKPRKSKDLTSSEQQNLNQQQASSSSSSSHRESEDSTAHQIPEHQITIGPTGGAEWMRRLKVAEQSPIHRSTDCIVSKDLGTSSDSELLKPAPSWSNVALKSSDQASTSKLKAMHFIISCIIDEKFLLGASAPSVPKATTSEEEQQRAAEIAAKKSRLKQKLVKSARSVAIFSLKLKERRAREAERLAKEKAEELATEMVRDLQYKNVFIFIALAIVGTTRFKPISPI
jgi:anoctamin-8